MPTLPCRNKVLALTLLHFLIFPKIICTGLQTYSNMRKSIIMFDDYRSLSLKMMKNVFYLMVKALLVLKMFKFLIGLFC